VASATGRSTEKIRKIRIVQVQFHRELEIDHSVHLGRRCGSRTVPPVALRAEVLPLQSLSLPADRSASHTGSPSGSLHVHGHLRSQLLGLS
jgi:hypothetical protein